MRIKELTESINDKGIFKMCFFGGLPGAGKSTIIQRITDGTVHPRVVNTDKPFEFLAKKRGMQATEAAWSLLGPASKEINKQLLYNYFNGMLPMFVDGTSSNSTAIIRRSGIAESLGYDIAMIWVEVDFDTALERVAQRDRKVPVDFVKSVYDRIEENKPLYKSRFGDRFIEIDNNDNNFDAMETKVYNTVSAFFDSEITNPIGSRTVKKMKENGWKYLVPNVYEKEFIDRLVDIWYMKA